jgi:hypothetical protein
MPGRKTAQKTGSKLENAVQEIAEHLGLEVRRQVRVGRRIWGPERRIDLVLWMDPARRLGIECKYQKDKGTAEEKIPTLIQDIDAWPIDGLVVFHGDGFSPNMRAFLLSSGKAVELPDLDMWLRLYFGLEIP